MKDTNKVALAMRVQKLLDQNSKRYRYFHGLIFFRPNKTVGIAFMSCGITGLLAANALPYDDLATSSLVLSSSIAVVYAAFHLVSSSKYS